MLINCYSKVKLFPLYLILVENNASLLVIQTTLKFVCLPLELEFHLFKLETLFDNMYFSSSFELNVNSDYYSADSYNFMLFKNFSYFKNVYLLLSTFHFVINQELDSFFKK